MEKELKGKVIVITGASSGFDEAMAEIIVYGISQEIIPF